MGIFKKLGRIKNNNSIEEKLYEVLQSDTFKSSRYQKEDLGEGMVVVYQDMWGWYKPRFVLNHNKQTAFEFIDEGATLLTVTEDDIDWVSLKKLPENAIDVAQRLSFHFPSFIKAYKNGVAIVEWQLNPDGRYYMDDDGFGMTDDEEINIYGVIDTEGKVVVKFQTVKDYKDIEKLRREAENKISV